MRAMVLAGMPSIYMAGTWGEVQSDLWDAAEAQGGLTPLGNPRLTNRQVIAVAQAARKLAKVWKEPIAYWPEVWYEALGYRQPGDKFKISSQHADAWAHEDTIDALWTMLSNLFVRFQERKVAPPMLDLDMSEKGWKAGIAAAWTQLKIDRGATKKRRKVRLPTAPGLDPIEVEEPTIPAPGAPITGPVVPSISRSTGLLLVLVLLAFAVKKR
jgi:hypothetical protein